MALEDGNYAAQPNNRIIWSIPSFTVKDEVPYDWKVQTSEWNVEDDMKWKAEDTDNFFYGIEEKNEEEEYLAEEKARADYAESFKEKNEKM